MTNDHAGWTGYHLNVRHRPDADTAPVREIVVALDGSEFAERSLEVADALAAAADLPLHLIAVRPSPADLTSAESYLARVARRAPRVGETTVDIGTDVAGVLADVTAGGALVVLATHARTAFGEVVFGSVADRVLRSTDRPVLLVGPAAGVPDAAFATMIVAEDGGLSARLVRPHAKAWSEHLLAVPWLVQAVPTAVNDPSLDVLETAHVQAVAHDFGPLSEWEVLHGEDPAKAIVDFATDRDAGMIAMAVHGRRRVGTDVGGGTALAVVRHAPCPVLALDPGGR